MTGTGIYRLKMMRPHFDGMHCAHGVMMQHGMIHEMRGVMHGIYCPQWVTVYEISACLHIAAT